MPDQVGHDDTKGLTVFFLIGQPSRARTALWVSRPQHLTGSRRRSYIPATLLHSRITFFLIQFYYISSFPILICTNHGFRVHLRDSYRRRHWRLHWCIHCWMECTVTGEYAVQSLKAVVASSTQGLAPPALCEPPFCRSKAWFGRLILLFWDVLGL